MEQFQSITMLILLTPHALVHEAITSDNVPIKIPENLEEKPIYPIQKQ